MNKVYEDMSEEEIDAIVADFDRRMAEGTEMEGMVPIKAHVHPDARVTVVREASSTFSVRLKSGEVDVLSRAAQARGLALGAFIRKAALAAAAGELDLSQAERLAGRSELRTAAHDLQSALAHLEQAIERV